LYIVLNKNWKNILVRTKVLLVVGRRNGAHREDCNPINTPKTTTAGSAAKTTAGSTTTTT
jgi:hypothetical protein